LLAFIFVYFQAGFLPLVWGHAISQSYGAEPFCFVNVIALQEAAEWLFDMAGCLGVFVC
jgi:hypothetical protein